MDARKEWIEPEELLDIWGIDRATPGALRFVWLVHSRTEAKIGERMKEEEVNFPWSWSLEEDLRLLAAFERSTSAIVLGMVERDLERIIYADHEELLSCGLLLADRTAWELIERAAAVSWERRVERFEKWRADHWKLLSSIEETGPMKLGASFWEEREARLSKMKPPEKVMEGEENHLNV